MAEVTIPFGAAGSRGWLLMLGHGYRAPRLTDTSENILRRALEPAVEEAERRYQAAQRARVLCFAMG